MALRSIRSKARVYGKCEIWIVLSRRLWLKLEGFFVTKVQSFLLALPAHRSAVSFSPDVRVKWFQASQGRRVGDRITEGTVLVLKAFKVALKDDCRGCVGSESILVGAADKSGL